MSSVLALWVGLCDCLCYHDRLSMGRPAVARSAHHSVQSACRFERLCISVSPQSISTVLCVLLSISVCVDQWINKHLSLLLPCFLCSPAFPSVRDIRRGVHSSWWSDTRNFLFLSAPLPQRPPLHHDTAGLREVAPHPKQVPLR